MHDDVTKPMTMLQGSDTAQSGTLDTLKKPRNYALGDTHARGGMGAILCAKDLNINRTVAMKVMLPGRDGEGELALRFVDEAKITGQLEHPNIVPVYELGVDEQNRPFYTMKFVVGITLKQVLEEIKQGQPGTIARYSLANLLTVFQKICDAVAFAHARNVVHRDLKPENIMLGDYGEVLVMDWGLAKVLELDKTKAYEGPTLLMKADDVSSTRLNVAEEYRTMAGTVMGSPHFMAPEQAEGQIDRIDARTDIYALGGILYNVLTLQSPVTGDTLNDLLEKVRTGRITPPSAVAAVYDRRKAATPDSGGHQPPLHHLPNARVPDSLSAVAMKALALARENRYQTVKELQQDIAAYQNGFATAAEHAGAWKQFTLFIKRHKAVSLSVAASLLVLVGISAAFTWRVIGERNRAENALASLRKTAPNFCDQARVLTERQQFTEALEKIDTAITLDDTKAEFHAQRGNILQPLMRFREATESYRRALMLNPEQPFAAENLALSEKMDTAMTKDGKMPRENLVELFAAYTHQKRVGEGIALGIQLQASTKEQLPLFRANLDRWLGKKYGMWVNPDGLISVDLQALSITDVEPLRGMPISFLNITKTKVSDLSPLAGMPLETLLLHDTSNISDISALRGARLKRLILLGTRISDLSALAGMPLELLEIQECSQVGDLTPLRGMPLRRLLLHGTLVRDLTPLAGMKLEALTVSQYVSDISVLRGMPLKTLAFVDGSVITNLEVLADCLDLEKLVLPRYHSTDIEFLRRLPKLKYLSRIAMMDKMEPTTTAEQFWKEYDAAKAKSDAAMQGVQALRAELRKQGVGADQITQAVSVANDGSLDINLAKLPVTNITSFAGLPIRRLSLWDAKVTNLDPLRGAPLERLNLTGCPVSDVSPLAGCPKLQWLSLSYTKVSDLRPVLGLKLIHISVHKGLIRDVSPLATCETLESIHLPDNAIGVEALRKLPCLKWISDKWNGVSGQPAQTAEEFWKEYDAAKAKNGK